MIDLGVKPKKDDACAPCAPMNADKKDEPCYPSLTLDGENVDKLKKEISDCENGKCIYAQVKLKITGSRDDKYGKSLSFDLVEMGEIEEEEPEEPAEEKKPSKYKNPAVGAALKK